MSNPTTLTGGKILVFAYGTLRQGMENHYVLEPAKFIGKAKTVDNYGLRVARLPHAIRGGGVSPLVGELYEVTEHFLDVLDEFEGHPTYYTRELVPVRTEDGKIVPAWIYFSNNPKGEVIPSGDFTDAKKERP